MSVRRSVVFGATAAMLAIVLQAAPAQAATTVPIASKVAAALAKLPTTTLQAVIVHASASATTTATLEAFQRSGTHWVREFPPMSARIGRNGFSDHHVEGTPSTPIGLFGFGSTMYGVLANPGVKFAYHHLVANDWWNENPKSTRYNTFEHSSTNPGAGSEALWKQTVAYQYFAFITYNVPAIAGKGSGIFLHESTSTPTAGCVSLSKANLLSVLRWLDPTKRPKIILSPDADLHRY